MTIKQALSKAATKIQNVSSTPLLDAEILLCHALGCERTFLYAHGEDEMDEEVYGAFFALAEKRAIHQPLAYLLGYKEFYGYKYFVDKRVLIPRPETEALVEKAVEKAKKLRKETNKQIVIADVCTGSGCVGISIALELIKAGEKTFQVILSDISSEALEVAKINAETLEPSYHQEHIKIINSDLLAFHMQEKLEIDILVANPPYISKKELKTLDKQIIDFEPILALDSGEDNLDIIKKLVKQAKQLEIPKENTFIESVDGELYNL